ncbi:hypothetical protein EAL2_c15080 [Peptoclostridium acidaminophilum DSM 3953]|uniref:Uncharacterized protein n=1 Tax=Peptoclostridium acidaminophilum DSM 3953 TaxID=1286171 RepID=W8TG44_PEPAC|nr:hypothetical protein [Peptoclostridium acidaminophilum]AHM56803.1 hypothetical protein EAL2_c15080 [Peptoclostridium acidaminophilum DSM 3953]
MSKCAMNFEGLYRKSIRKKSIKSNMVLVAAAIFAISIAAVDLTAAAYIREVLASQDIAAAEDAEKAYEANIEYVDMFSEHFSSGILDSSRLKAVEDMLLIQIEGVEMEKIICNSDLLSIQGSSSEYSGIMRYCNFVDECQGVQGDVIVESINRENRDEYGHYDFLLSLDLKKAAAK